MIKYLFTTDINITHPEVEIDNELLGAIQPESESCTILHCHYVLTGADMLDITLSPDTFLIQDDGKRRKLIKAFNINIFPEWSYVESSSTKFTLVFEGLSKNCKSFYLQEIIDLPLSFYTDVITRNSSDVYSVDIIQ